MKNNQMLIEAIKLNDLSLFNSLLVSNKKILITVIVIILPL